MSLLKSFSWRLFVRVTWMLCIFTFIHLLRLWWTSRIGLDAIMITQLQYGTPVQMMEGKIMDDKSVSDLFDFRSRPPTNVHLELLLKCSLKVNNKINSVRLPHPIFNISLTPPSSMHDPAQQYFNPTLIPLPSFSPYPYLLLSRLVTSGLHQESHICLAIICHSRESTHTQHLPSDTQKCSPDDVEALGARGGLRCAIRPERLNIPPTPALRCEGAWVAFPDIPGFHDPRVFWSGRDEPLVIVNSGSQYGCVGLWVVDLRAVYPELDDLMRRKGKFAPLDTAHGDGLKRLQAKMSYPYLTELTRNPRTSRRSIEKNWILFFPKREETWIQYDLVGHNDPTQKVSGKTEYTDQGAPAATNFRATHAEHNNLEISLIPTNISNFTEAVALDRNSSGVGDGISHSTMYNVQQDLRHGYHRRWPSSPTDNAVSLNPSRSLAKIIGSGYTTPNLTAEDETPCLSTNDLFDNMGNKGHWHQGSNSLRLILCQHHDVSCLGGHNEDELLRDGKVVHFAILHRKFSNELKLPMRYERYVMVWEGNPPFRMIGISRNPILFAGERAQPWSDSDNDLDGDLEAETWKRIYFTYTPSLAWSWRREYASGSRGGFSGDLGTGYMDDDVIVGIGMDDVAQGFTRVKARELVDCLRLCPDFEHA